MKEWIKEYRFVKGERRSYEKKCKICETIFLSNGPKEHCSWKCFLILKRNIDENGCWIWKGSLSNKGYGKTSYSKYVHRLSYEAFVSEIPKGKCVLHKCDVTNCFNPEHLFIGSLSDNMKDMVEKGRNKDYKGSKHPYSKLTEEIVLEIREKIKNGFTNRAISKEYGLNETYVSHIKNRRNWTHI